jgi:hypothetical protein
MDTPLPTHPLGVQMPSPKPALAEAGRMSDQLPLFRAEARRGAQRTVNSQKSSAGFLSGVWQRSP